jgi:alkylation response protein AidB-like acyl-CoA dehydrogenase
MHPDHIDHVDLELRRQILGTAEELAQSVRSLNAAIEEQRCLPDEVAQSLADAGLYRMLTPKHLGGHEVDVHTFVLAVERLARGDASVAWCTFISCTSAMIAGYLPEAEARAVFSRPDLKLAGVFAPRGKALPATWCREAGRGARVRAMPTTSAAAAWSSMARASRSSCPTARPMCDRCCSRPTRSRSRTTGT